MLSALKEINLLFNSVYICIYVYRFGDLHNASQQLLALELKKNIQAEIQRTLKTVASDNT